MPKTPCTVHPNAFAGWRCTRCEKLLCPACTGIRQVGSTQLSSCSHCGDVVEVLLVPRAEARSFPSRLRSVFAYPLSKTGLWTILGAGVGLYLLSLLGLRAVIFWHAILWAYVFSLARASAMGSADLDVPDFTGVWDFFQPMRSGMFAIFVAWLPALIFLVVLGNTTTPKAMEVSVISGPPAAGLEQMTGAYAIPDEAGNFAVPGEDAVDPATLTAEQAAELEGVKDLRRYTLIEEEPVLFRAARNPLFWLLLLLGFFLGPMALAIGVAGGTYLQMLSPRVLVGSVLKSPTSYLFLAGGLFAIAGGQAVVMVISALLSGFPIPIVPGVLGCMLEVYLPLVAARVIGLYLFVHGAELGYLHASDAYQPALPDAVPVGTVPATVGGTAAYEAGRAAGVEPDHAAFPAGIARNAAAWQAPSREVELPPPPEGVEVAPLYVRPKEISLDDGDDEGAAAGAPADLPARPRPTELDPTALDNRALDFLDEGPAEAASTTVATALAAKQYAHALALFRTADAAAKANVGGEGLFELGRQAATEGAFKEAAQLLKSAAQIEPASPIAPKALVILGRVVGERMGDVEAAKKVFAHIVRAYPGTEAAKFAEGRLKASA